MARRERCRATVHCGGFRGWWRAAACEGCRGVRWGRGASLPRPHRPCALAVRTRSGHGTPADHAPPAPRSPWRARNVQWIALSAAPTAIKPAAWAVIGSWYTEIDVDDEIRAPTPDLAPPTHRQRHPIMLPAVAYPRPSVRNRAVDGLAHRSAEQLDPERGTVGNAETTGRDHPQPRAHRRVGATVGLALVGPDDTRTVGVAPRPDEVHVVAVGRAVQRRGQDGVAG